MKKKLLFWGGLFFAFVIMMLVPTWRDLFLGFSNSHVFLGAFIKFFILASAGEIVALKLSNKQWLVPKGMPFKACIWGFMGMMIVIFFSIFGAGVESLLEKGYLPGNNLFLKAFYISFLMNASFGVAMMAFHRITDTWIENRMNNNKLSVVGCIEKIEWSKFFNFVVLKTLPLFWIPMHTITFLLPSTYRVLMAASLSFALGILLAIAKGKR